SDYLATSGTLTFAPGTLSQAFVVPILGDTAVEPDQTFFVNLGRPINALLAASRGTGTIVNDDTTIAINDVTLPEGDSGPTAFPSPARPPPPPPSPPPPKYPPATAPPTAVTDYTAIPSTPLTFAAGETTKTVTVAVAGDTAIEPDETFLVKLSGSTNAAIA